MRETEKLLQERGLNKLTSQQKDLLKGQTEGITSSDHTVFNLISKYAKLVSPSLHRVSPALNPSICHLIISTYHGFILGVFGPNKALLTGCGLRGPTVSDYLFLDWTLQFFLRTLSRKLNSNHHQDIGASSKTLVLPANPELLFRKNRLNLQRSPSNLKSFFFYSDTSFFLLFLDSHTYVRLHVQQHKETISSKGKQRERAIHPTEYPSGSNKCEYGTVRDYRQVFSCSWTQLGCLRAFLWGTSHWNKRLLTVTFNNHVASLDTLNWNNFVSVESKSEKLKK